MTLVSYEIHMHQINSGIKHLNALIVHIYCEPVPSSVQSATVQTWQNKDIEESESMFYSNISCEQDFMSITKKLNNQYSS